MTGVTARDTGLRPLAHNGTNLRLRCGATGTNWHLNREMIVLHNTGPTDRKLSDWLVRDKANHRYLVPEGFTLKAGRYVRIHTGKGRNDGNVSSSGVAGTCGTTPATGPR